jgi:hypothetical protein
MLELIGAVIEKLAELLLERKLKNRKHGGCVELFQLYCKFGYIIGTSKNVCWQLEQYASTPSDSYLRHIFIGIKELMQYSADFMEMVYRACDQIMVYDLELSSELERVVQAKVNLLRSFYKKMPDPYSTPGRHDFKTLKKKMKDFKINFSEFAIPKHQIELWHTPFKTMKGMKGTQVKIIDFDKKEDVLRFITQAKRNIEVFEEIKSKLRLFIQRNCEYNDLFP